MSEILIASSDLDEATWGPVAGILRSKGHKVLVYKADNVAAGITPFTVHTSPGSGGLRFYYDDHPINPSVISAAWYRRPNMFGSWPESEETKHLSLDRERRAIQSVLWAKVPEVRWLNSPLRINHAERKLLQLELADFLGMNIPTTVVANQHEEIVKSLPGEAIFKASHVGIMNDEGEARYLFTTAVTPGDFPPQVNPFPGLWQPYIAKRREWRITVVGQRCFDTAIYTTDGARVDWRRTKYCNHVTFKNETFPDEWKEKCVRYLELAGLRFGAFDFIEDDEGRIVFLECNPNGQYGWLEVELEQPISDAIANELVSITHGR